MKIENPKLQSLAPEWARFPGFSLLFDNPGDSYRSVPGGRLLDCRPAGDPALALCAALADGMDALDRDALKRRGGFCSTTVGSYHVTAWDGLNPAVLDRVRPTVAREMTPMFDALPALGDDWRLLAESLASDMAALDAALPIRFRMDRVRCSTGIGVVVDLIPDGETQQIRFDRFCAARDAVAARWRSRWGWVYDTPLQPHITLGYFANPVDAQSLEQEMARWDTVLMQHAAAERLSFATVGLYAFTDMIRFYRIDP